MIPLPRTSDPEDAFQHLPDGELRYLLTGARVKITSARLTILRTLKSELRPITASTLVEKLTNACDETTAYRALEVLVKTGLVHRIHIDAARSYYEIASGRKHHHHAVCTSCGDIEDVLSCVSLDLNRKANADLKKFRHIESHSLEFFGVCKKCEK